jgi:hypothetical protein
VGIFGDIIISAGIISPYKSKRRMLRKGMMGDEMIRTLNNSPLLYRGKHIREEILRMLNLRGAIFSVIMISVEVIRAISIPLRKKTI